MIRRQAIHKEIEGPSENINESENLSNFGRDVKAPIGEIRGSGQTALKIFEDREAKLKDEEEK